MKILFGKYKNCYKANLHCHSTCSDGTKTPEELKEAYKSRGYSVIAYTDHEHIIAHPELCDSDFVAISACELAIKEFPEESTLVNKTMKVTHINLYAKEIDNTVTPCYSTVQDHFKREMLQHLIRKDGEYSRKYSPECINEMIRIAHSRGFLVSYNHANWSLETAEDYLKYDGFDFVEIYNHGCVVDGYQDDEHVYSDMLMQGKRVMPTATDDNHNRRDIFDPTGDSFGGFVMINADTLDYGSIIEALERGEFYASTGAYIYSITRDGDTVTVKASPSSKIVLRYSHRIVKAVYDPDGNMTEATFTLPRADMDFRITVHGRNGEKAYSQYYRSREA
ncbi:MAG: PHP domain-containing protein [Clostridia bacterium]|nr:PHP domain-containing protein [Clostridia bacterium]